MKKLNTYISEALVKTHVGKKRYNYFPKTREELKKLVEQLLGERGDEADLNDIDVSEVTDMREMFGYMKKFNGDISEWNVSNVTDMMGMFVGCINFNCDISGWDVSKVTNFGWMFEDCKSFNQDISKWEINKMVIGKKHTLHSMFLECPLKEEYRPVFPS